MNNKDQLYLHLKYLPQWPNLIYTLNLISPLSLLVTYASTSPLGFNVCLHPSTHCLVLGSLTQQCSHMDEPGEGPSCLMHRHCPGHHLHTALDFHYFNNIHAKPKFIAHYHFLLQSTSIFRI